MKVVLQALALKLLWLVAWLPVAWMARKGRYAWWAITPDDPFAMGAPVPHFGHYEPRVRAVYARYGRFWGDLYWLGFRNVAYGLAYRWKPQWLKGPQDYSRMPFAVRFWGPVRLTLLYKLWEAEVELGLVKIIVGSKLSPIVNYDPSVARSRPINMDGRPTLSLRKGAWWKKD
jgi:hypothetical protein